jgi:hypothetical protein
MARYVAGAAARPGSEPHSYHLHRPADRERIGRGLGPSPSTEQRPGDFPEGAARMSDTDYGPLFSRADPDTSRQAAEQLVSSGQHQRQCEAVLAALRVYPDSTSAELARSRNFDRHMVAKRLPDLRRAGLVENGEARTCAATGRKALVWREVKP